MKNNKDQSIEFIDDVLRELEDIIHGEISDRITIARKKLQALDLAPTVSCSSFDESKN